MEQQQQQQQQQQKQQQGMPLEAVHGVGSSSC
jgi:hypothetical protein